MAIAAVGAQIAPAAQGEWVFHSFPKDNKPVQQVAALGDTLFIAANFGTEFYRSTDHGRTWQSLDTAGYAGLYNVEVFGKEVFRFGDAGIRRSRDNGTTWVSAQGGMGEAMVERMYEVGGLLFAEDANGFYRSTDRGDSWTRVTAPVERSIICMAEVQGTLYFYSMDLSQDSSLYRSTDNGLTWKLAAMPSEHITLVDRLVSHAGYLFLTSGGMIFRSRPDSAGWTRLDAPGANPIFWDLQSDGALLRTFGNNGPYHSADTGKTWVSDTPDGDNRLRYLIAVQGPRMIGSVSDKYDLVESQDYGVTWNSLNQPSHLQPRENLISSGPNLIAHTSGESMFLTADLGIFWTETTTKFKGVTVLDGSIFALTMNRDLIQSNTHGASWTTAPAAARLVLSTGLLAGGAGWLYTSVDSIFRRPATLDSRPWQISPALVEPPRSSGVRHFTKIQAMGTQVYASTWDGRWQYSQDTGNTWSPVPDALQSAGLRDLAGESVLLAGTNHGLFRSADSGKTWNPVTATGQPGLGDTIYSVLHRGNAFFAGCHGRIYISLDDGLTWGATGPANFKGNPGNMEVHGRQLVLIEPGLGIWSGPLPEGYVPPVGISAPASRAEAGFRLKSGVFRPGDRVEWRLSEPGPVRLSLYNLAGRRMADLHAGNLAAGNHSLALDPALLGGIRPGYYLLNLKAGTRSWTLRMVLQR